MLGTCLTNQQHSIWTVHSEKSGYSLLLVWRFNEDSQIFYSACEKQAICWINCNCCLSCLLTAVCSGQLVGPLGVFKGLGGSGQTEVAVWVKGFVVRRWNTSWARWGSEQYLFINIFLFWRAFEYSHKTEEFLSESRITLKSKATGLHSLTLTCCMKIAQN